MGIIRWQKSEIGYRLERGRLWYQKALHLFGTQCFFVGNKNSEDKSEYLTHKNAVL